MLSTKPISSPGRAGKYPPPLMRFLRSNVGSKSRGRSRSSPMFVLRKKNTTTAIETQEPSSPKVTCMGQVRVRRSKQQQQQPGKRTGTAAGTKRPRRRCKWIRKAFFCNNFNPRIKKPISFRPIWREFVSFFRRRSEIRENSSKPESKISNKSEDFVEVKLNDEEDEEIEEEEEAKVFVTSSSTPPRNALLLTRCRSAPYRSSSLASRFWESPLASEEEEEEETERENRGDEDEEEEENPISGRESIGRDSDQESRTDPEERKVGFSKEFDGSINKIRERFVEELKTKNATTTTQQWSPLILTRCKSEPARIGENKLDPDMCFLNKRRLGFT